MSLHISPSAQTQTGKPTRNWSWRAVAPWLSGLLTLAAVVLVFSHFGTLEEFTRLIFLVEPGWFVLALAAQALTYLCVALAWHITLRRAGHPRPLGVLLRLGVAKLFTDQVVPSSGISGAILVAGALRHRGVPAHAALAVLLVGLVSYFAAYLAVVLCALFIISLYHRANMAMVGAVMLFTVIVVAIPTGVLWMKEWGSRLPVRWVKRLPGAAHLLQAIAEAPADLLRDPMLLVQSTLLECADFALDAATLWMVLRGLGQDPGIWVAFASFVMAAMAATLAPIPLGLGSFEAACVGMLHLLGVAIEPALAATLLLRGLTFWLPMLPGLWLARREMATPSAPQPGAG